MKELIVFLVLSLPIKGKVVDYYTNEELVGVKIDNVYTDFEGNVEINKGKTLIVYPSYESVDTVLYEKQFFNQIKTFKVNEKSIYYLSYCYICSVLYMQFKTRNL